MHFAYAFTLLPLISTLAAAQPTRVLDERSPAHIDARDVLDSQENVMTWWMAQKCDVCTAQMPTAPTPLPSPTGKLFHVALGRGNQNYTCDLSNSTAVPAAVGAVATLYNATCIAANYPWIMNLLPTIAINFPYSASHTRPLLGADRMISGHHYFTNTTSPMFNMNTFNDQYGIGAVKKVNASSAPAGAVAEQAQAEEYISAALSKMHIPAGTTGKPRENVAVANGDVAWLYLSKDTGAIPQDQKFSSVYRVNTVGGQPPASCNGQKAAFSVPYAAEYWLYE